MALQTFAGGLGTSPSAASPSPERQAQVPVAAFSLRCILKHWGWKAHCPPEHLRIRDNGAHLGAPSLVKPSALHSSLPTP